MNRIVYGGLVAGLFALVTSAIGCGSSPCSDLAACGACDSTCQAVVAQGDANTCKQALDAYNALNLCSGTGPQPDMIVNTDPIVQPDVRRDMTMQPDARPDVVIVEDEVNPPPPDMTAVVVSPENVGSACTPDDMLRDDANCGSAQEQICLSLQEGATAGVCSVLFCEITDPQTGASTCGAGNYCVQADANGTTLCLAGCTVAAGGCDTGLTCQPILGIASSCLPPSCTADTDCTDANNMPDPTQYCNTDVSSCLNAGDAAAKVGDGCAEDVDCPRNGLCLSEADFGFPGGYCVTPECDATAFACEAGAVCMPIPDTGGICFKGCTADTDCVDSTGAARTGYTCQMGACAPAPM